MSSSPISSSSPSSLWRTPFNTKSNGACMASSLQMWFDSTLIWIWIIDRLDRTLGSWKKGNGSVEKIKTHESCQEQDQYHWVLFTNCQLGECCNGAANRWCAQTILQVPFSATVPVPSDVSCCLAMLALKKPSLFHGPCKFKFLVSPLPLCQRIPPVPNGIFKTSMPKWKDWPGNKTNIEVYL